IKIFNSKGEYLNTFNRLGRGPQEYDELWDPRIDNASGNIVIKTTNKVLEYFPNGECIRNFFLPAPGKIDNISVQNNRCLKLGDYYFFPCHALSTYSVIITDSFFKVVKRLKYPPEEVDFIKTPNRHSPYSFLEPHINLHNNRILLINGVNKYVLSIDKDLSVDTVFIIDYGKYFPENDKSGSRSSHNPWYLLRMYNVFYESDNYLFMRFYLGSLSDKPFKMLNLSGGEWTDPYACALFNKETEEFTFLDQPEKYQRGFIDDIEGGPGIWPKYVSADNYMISYIPADEFIAHAESHKVSEKFKKIADGLKETDNYVFVRVKLK
ncbi:MAG: 6-bladed beta-propeller, partial [Bacteroidales bacterium]|nr:6-bladed beta-propeller [Bacteroidales bacterium]